MKDRRKQPKKEKEPPHEHAHPCKIFNLNEKRNVISIQK